MSPKLPPMWYVLLAAILSTLTVSGNGLVIYLIVSKARLHNTTNWIILSLAIADASLGLSYLPTQCLLVPDTPLRYSILSFLSAASAANLCLMALDRFIFITRPLRYTALMTTKRAVLMIFTAWTVSFLPHFVFWLKVDVLTSAQELNDFKNFIAFDLVVFELLPVVVLVFVAARIVCIVRQQSRREEVQMTQLRFNLDIENRSEIPARHQRASSMKVMCIAITVFFLCYSLELIFTIKDQFSVEKLRDYRFSLSVLFNVNSAINPFAYAFFKKDIKNDFRRVFGCKKGTARRGAARQDQTSTDI